MMNMMWTVETGDTGFNNTIHLVELVLGDTDDTHDVSRYQNFTILVSCIPRYILLPRY